MYVLGVRAITGTILFTILLVRKQRCWEIAVTSSRYLYQKWEKTQILQSHNLRCISAVAQRTLRKYIITVKAVPSVARGKYTSHKKLYHII
jgi:hypothetical protein